MIWFFYRILDIDEQSVTSNDSKSHKILPTTSAIDSRNIMSITSNGVIRQTHREIEKRRRDKINTYITELSLLIPSCVTLSRKFDKLTVLRLAVQHLKSLQGD
jgi:hypothetical protein